MHLVLSEGEQGGESLATYWTHVVFGGAAVRLSVLAKTILREEGPGAHVALVVPLDEVCLFLSGTCWGYEARDETSMPVTDDRLDMNENPAKLH